ncbi:unnamed protein product [Bemisia tabaci]|uniref:Uncharacterized protein n=1 Tax=Bemisia tabaci TaxID=7038 RepID=A0A9P0A280_BEMTA|nr:unnamed protein product [Bemisia tabaci]
MDITSESPLEVLSRAASMRAVQDNILGLPPSYVENAELRSLRTKISSVWSYLQHKSRKTPEKGARKERHLGQNGRVALRRAPGHHSPPVGGDGPVTMKHCIKMRKVTEELQT